MSHKLWARLPGRHNGVCIVCYQQLPVNLVSAGLTRRTSVKLATTKNTRTCNHNNDDDDDDDNDDEDNDDDEDRSNKKRSGVMWKDRQGRTGVTKRTRERAIDQQCVDENAQVLQF